MFSRNFVDRVNPSTMQTKALVLGARLAIQKIIIRSQFDSDRQREQI